MGISLLLWSSFFLGMSPAQKKSPILVWSSILDIIATFSNNGYSTHKNTYSELFRKFLLLPLLYTHTHTHTHASLQWNNFNPNYSTRIFLNPQVLLIHSTQNLPFRRTLCPAFTLFKLSWLQTVSKLSRKKASVLFLFFYILSNIIKCLY
jgi:hypothetical protein